MRLPLLIAALIGLAACTFDPETGQFVPPPLADQPHPVPYVATKDGPHSIPAVPLEKVNPAYQRTIVANPLRGEAAGTILIDTAARFLYLVQDDRTALRYGISVGREGFDWTGEAVVARFAQWPTWTPPPEMIRRQPDLAKWAGGQPGGPRNPLGARAIYLTQGGVDTGYRIHGTPEWSSIGRAASSGCIRMVNQDVIDLYGRVQKGAKVIVR
ncbi:MAG: L,D-transpeptidase [Gemmobacter sp.]|jgi:lipoprotein-anchoring transpeptidase ErfK/SrfK|nr:L,D-transpeptidase [Gemmobacter sp.]